MSQGTETVVALARLAMAIFSYRFHNLKLLEHTAQVKEKLPNLGERLRQTRHDKPPEYFYGKTMPEKFLFRQVQTETWEEYWGAVVSNMESPSENEGWFSDFKEAHRLIFSRFANEGVLTVEYSTEVLLGQPIY